MLPLSTAIKAALQNRVKQPQLILEIDGLPVFSSTPVRRFLKYGDEIKYGDEGLYYGGYIEDKSILPYIDLKRSTQQITQQLNIDRGGSNSATSFDVTVIDKSGLLTEYITPNKRIDEILSRKAKLYLNLEGASHPSQSILFFSGIVAGAPAGAGYVKFNLVSSEKLKNLDLFPKLSTELTANINNLVTTIPVVSTESFVLPADAGTLRTYILINDEIIEYTGKTSTSFTGCVRGQFGTIAANHAIGDNAESSYRLIGNLRDLSLKLMLSGINENYLENEQILGVNQYGLQTVQNAVFIATINANQTVGVVAGDIATITGGANAGVYTVLSVVGSESGSYLILDANLTTEGAVGFLSIKSKYSVLPKLCGLEMTPDQVDVAEFEIKYNQFSASFFEYDFFIKDQVNGTEFINTQILFPSGCYSLPRKAKTSIGLTIPPLAQAQTTVIDWTNVTNASDLIIERNISNNFYNAVVYRFDKDQVNEKYLRGKIRQSADSTNRIKVANKALTISADGVRFENNFVEKFDIQGRRFLDRYQYAAESIEINVNFETGFPIEIGDTVILKGAELQISDTKDQAGTRKFRPRLFEVQNKTFNLSGKPIRLKLVDSAYSLNGRYGIISPSSKIDVGSSTTVLKLKKSFGTTIRIASEGEKWRSLSGVSVKIRSKDHTFSEIRTIVGVDPLNDNALIITPALSIAPAENYVVDIANYSASIDPESDALSKAMFVFWNNQIEVVLGNSSTQFTVSNLQLPDIKVGYIVKIHDDDYNYQTPERIVVDISGNTITVDSDLGLTPSPQDKIELLGFVDGGKPYRWL
jgi:hypothetical protein